MCDDCGICIESFSYDFMLSFFCVDGSGLFGTPLAMNSPHEMDSVDVAPVNDITQLLIQSQSCCEIGDLDFLSLAFCWVWEPLPTMTEVLLAVKADHAGTCAHVCHCSWQVVTDQEWRKIV